MSDALNMREGRTGARGAIIPVVAVFATCVVTFVTLLAVDATLVKYASTVLKHELEQVCKSAGNRPQFPSETVKDFERMMQFWVANSRPARLTLTGARVFSPVAFNDPGSNPPWANCAAMGLAGDDDSCNLSCGGIPCEYVYNAYRYNSASAGFPNDFWTGNGDRSMYGNNPHIGTTVACEASARYETFVSGTRRLISRVAYFRPTRGGWGGYAVAVAPQVTTISQPWVNNPDGAGFDSGSILGSSSGPFSVTALIGTAGSPGPLADAFTGGTNDNFTPFTVSGSADTLSGHPGVAAFSLAQRDLIGGCLALPTLVRNGIASILYENIIRNAYTFSGTNELSIINAKHEDVCNRGTAPQYADGVFPSRANAPVQVNAGSEDPGARAYQIPYLTHDSGLTATFDGCGASKPPAGRNTAGVFHNDGWINPFLSADGANVLNSNGPYTATIFSGTGAAAKPARSDWRHLHSLIAGQLRQCYSLSSSSKLGRLTLRVADTTGFEPPEKSSRLFLRGSDYAPGDPWDQSGTNPWSLGAGSADALTIPELLSVIGSAQNCPTRSSCTRGGVTLLPTSQQDMQPDLYGFIRHFYPAMAADPNASRMYNSFRSPGIFPFLLSSNGEPNSNLPDSPNRTVPFAAISAGTSSNPPAFDASVNPNDRRYTWSPSTRGLTIFLHKPPTRAEALLMHPYMIKVDAAGFKAFPVTIVYIPTNPLDAQYSTGVSENGAPMDRIRYAFNVPDPTTTTPFDIYAHFTPKLYALTPFDSTIQGQDSCSTRYPTAQPALALRRYWSDLLRDPWAAPPAECPKLPSIHTLATGIFNDRATAYMVRF